VGLWQWIESFASKSAPNFLVALASLVVGIVALPLAALQTWRAFHPQAPLSSPAAPPVSDALVKLLQALFPNTLWELAQGVQRTPWGPSVVQGLTPHDKTAPADWCHQLAERAQAKNSLRALLELLRQLREGQLAEIDAVAGSLGLPTQAPLAPPADEAARVDLRKAYILRLNNCLRSLPDLFQPGGQSVKVEDVYVELTLTDGPDALDEGPDALRGGTSRHMGRIGRARSGDRRTMKEVLDDPHRLWTLLGDPGSGKTTLLRHAALSLCETPGRVPVYVTATALVEGVERALAKLVGKERPELLDWLLGELGHGRVILLIDGLDEADPRLDPRERLRVLSERYGVNNTFVVASRPINFKPIASTFQQLALCPLDEKAQERLLTGWLGDEARVAGALERLRRTPRLRRLAESPLLLTLAGLVLREGGELPTRRADLYDRALGALLSREHTAETERGPCLRSPERALALLGGAALRLHGAEADVYPYDRLIAALRAEAGWRGWSPWGSPEAFVTEVAERTGLLIPDTGKLDGARAFLFPHRTFREHLAATALVKGLERWGGMDGDGRLRAWASARAGVVALGVSAALNWAQQRREANLARVLNDGARRPERWAEVLALSCGRLGPGGADALVRRITKEGNTALLLRVVADAEGISAETVRGTLKLEVGWEMEKLSARQKVIEEIPLLVKDLSVAVGLLEQIAKATTCGHDLFWVRAVLRRIERGEVEGSVLDGSVEDAKRAAKGAADNVLSHLDSGKRAELLALLKPWWRPIPAGSFDMGAKSAFIINKPIYSVTFTSGFQMLGVPVTWAMYRLFDPRHDEARYDFRPQLPPEAQDDVPVYRVSWFASVMFAEWVGARLPLEAEWEYACRAGTRMRYWSGDSDEDLERVGWFSRNSGGHPHPVAQKPSNAWGLHDVHGNLWEWCSSYDPPKVFVDERPCITIDPQQTAVVLDADAATAEASDGPDGKQRARGCSFVNRPEDERTAPWFGGSPSQTHFTFGFRLLLPTPEQP
jgi:formylglycine-generating enzyme required for sulfatase activity